MGERHRIFLVFSLLYILAYFYRVSMAVLSHDLVGETPLSAAQLGTLSGAFFYAFALAQLPLGPILDHWGGKRTVFSFGMMTMGGGLLFATSHDYFPLLLGRVLMGVGSASVLMGALKTFTNWFDQKEFGRVSGFTIAAGNLGNMAGTFPFAHACETIGWRTTFLVVLAIQGGALLSLAFIRESPIPIPPRPVTFRGVFSPFRRICTTPLYWRLALIAFFWYAAYMSVQGLWGGPYLRDAAGLSPQGAAFSLFCSSAGFLVGSLLVGKGAEKAGSNGRLMVMGESGLLLSMGYFLLPSRLFPSVLLPVILFFFGLFVASGVAIYPLIRERFPKEMIGTALTSVNLFILLGAATVQQLMGGVIDRLRGVWVDSPEPAYHAAFLIPFVGLAAAVVVFYRTVVRTEVSR
ncbi:MAG: MFS transporter [Desulfuromonadia bacterium]